MCTCPLTRVLVCKSHTDTHCASWCASLRAYACARVCAGVRVCARAHMVHVRVWCAPARGEPTALPRRETVTQTDSDSGRQQHIQTDRAKDRGQYRGHFHLLSSPTAPPPQTTKASVSTSAHRPSMPPPYTTPL